MTVVRGCNQRMNKLARFRHVSAEERYRAQVKYESSPEGIPDAIYTDIRRKYMSSGFK